MFRVISHESLMQIHLVVHFSDIVKKTTEKLLLFHECLENLSDEEIALP